MDIKSRSTDLAVAGLLLVSYLLGCIVISGFVIETADKTLVNVLGFLASAVILLRFVSVAVDLIRDG